MVTKPEIPVVRLLIKCFVVERDTMCPISVISCPRVIVVIAVVSMVTKLDIAVVRLLTKYFLVKRDTMCPCQSPIAPGQN